MDSQWEAAAPWVIFGGRIWKLTDFGDLEVPGTLIIGYGNLWRSDDGVGCRVAYELEQIYRDDADVEVIASQQLTPEMADDVARSKFVLFLDAATGEKPGTLRQTRVSPHRGPSGFTHHLTPSSLLAAAEQLYGDVPEAVSITLAGWSLELGSQLSPEAAHSFPEMIRLAKNAVERHRSMVAENLVPTK